MLHIIKLRLGFFVAASLMIPESLNLSICQTNTCENITLIHMQIKREEFSIYLKKTFLP
jgi:hypothetical protein